MKKLFILLLMVAVAFTLFAQEAEDDYTAIDQDAAEETGSGREFDVEITAGIPMHWTDGYDHPDDNKDKYVSQALSVGLALTYNFNKKFGITLDTDYAFVRYVGNGSAGASSEIYDGYDGLFEANALLGAVVYLYNGNFLRIPLAFGIHYYFFCGPDYWDYGGGSGVWVSATDHQFGPGAYLGLQFHFNKSLYILARTNVTVDIARYHTWKAGSSAAGITEDSEFELITSLHVKPTFGLGIKW